MTQGNITPAPPTAIMPLPDAACAEMVQSFERIKTSMLTDSHYQTYEEWDPRQQKKVPKSFIKKKGWRLLARAFQVSTEVVDEKITRHRETQRVFSAKYTVKAIHVESGQYLESIGYADQNEKKFQKDADIIALAETRATSRAISGLIAGGEPVAEDITPMEAPIQQAQTTQGHVPPAGVPQSQTPDGQWGHHQPTQASPPPQNQSVAPQAPPPPASAAPPQQQYTQQAPPPQQAPAPATMAGGLSEKQFNYITKLVGERQVTDGEAINFINHYYGKQSFDLLSKSEASDTIQWLTSLPQAAPGAPPPPPPPVGQAATPKTSTLKRPEDHVPETDNYASEYEVD